VRPDDGSETGSRPDLQRGAQRGLVRLRRLRSSHRIEKNEGQTKPRFERTSGGSTDVKAGGLNDASKSRPRKIDDRPLIGRN